MRESKEARKQRQAVEYTEFLDVLRRAGNVVEEEVRFHRKRKWRLDVTLPKADLVWTYGTSSFGFSSPIALEIEGRGRHQSFYGYSKDIEKYNEVTLAGYRLLRVTRDMIGNGEALELLSRAGVRVQPDA